MNDFPLMHTCHIDSKSFQMSSPDNQDKKDKPDKPDKQQVNKNKNDIKDIKKDIKAMDIKDIKKDIKAMDRGDNTISNNNVAINVNRAYMYVSRGQIEDHNKAINANAHFFLGQINAIIQRLNNLES